MTIAEYPSKLSLPQKNPGVETILEYLIIKFPYVSAQIWHDRILKGKVHCEGGMRITFRSPFIPQLRIYYYREVENEPKIPFTERIVFQDEHLLVAYKPHFLAVMPGGIYVNECLQTRLRRKTGIQSLQALHRLDRVTAGLIIFSVHPESRHHYHRIFETRKIRKTYQAIANIFEDENLTGKSWEIKNRIGHSNPRFIMCVKEGEANSHSQIRCLKQSGDKALFELNPITGKTHQLRLHMHTLGWPILNDKYYPKLQAFSEDNYEKPLQLLAKEIEFLDPLTQKTRYFRLEKDLSL